MLDAMRNILSLIALLIAGLHPMNALSAKGTVVYYKSGCDYYIVETNMGFVLLEWYGGNDPSEGDILVGDYESYGMKDIYNLSADAETRVWVENFWLSRNQVIEDYFDQCN
ncbi:MAG: hypothetical protein R3C70_19715 [Geminicoccaceae bacterium]